MNGVSNRSDSNPLQPLTRFTDRVADYVMFRPDYPAAVIQTLQDRAGLGPNATVADIGAGTGIFTRQLLETGATVYAIEPNAAMRSAAEAQLAASERFISSTGTSEATGLPDATVNLITCAQAFHWFEPVATRQEFLRISQPGASWALVWNTIPPVLDSFLKEYERIKATYAKDFATIRDRTAESKERFDAFFGPSGWERVTFKHHQILDQTGLRGRLLSSSFVPTADDPRAVPMLEELDRLFDQSQQDGLVRMEYETRLYLGQPK